MKKSKSFIGKLFSAIGTVLVIVLGLVIAGAVFLVCSTVFMDTVSDDVDTYAAAEPMALSERLRFSTDGTVEMKLDKSDIYWYYRQCMGEDFDDRFRDAAETVGLDFEGCGLNMQPKSIFVDLSARFGPVPLHVRIPSSISFTGREFVLAPEGVKIGIISVSLETLFKLADEMDFLDDMVELDEDNMEDLELRLPCTPAFLEWIDSIKPGEDCLTVKGRMNTDFLEECDKGYNTYNLTHARFLCKGYSMAEDIIESRLDSREAAEKVLFGLLTEDPGLLDDVLGELMCFMDQTVSSGYTPNLENHQFVCRVADVFDRMELVEKHRILEADYNENKKNWDNLIDKLTDDYNSGRITVEGTELLYRNDPFNMKEYLGKDWNLYECFMDADGCTFALADYAEAKDPKNPKLVRVFADAADIPEGLTPDAGYPLALIIKGMDGDYWAGFRVYVTENKENYLRLFKVSDSMMEELLHADAFPVWRYE